MAVKLYIERFSEETYDRMWEFYDGGSSDDDVDEKDTVDKITRALKNIDVADDWEDLASDSD